MGLWQDPLEHSTAGMVQAMPLRPRYDSGGQEGWGTWGVI